MKKKEYCCRFSFCKQKFSSTLSLSHHYSRAPMHDNSYASTLNVRNKQDQKSRLFSDVVNGDNNSVSERNVKQKTSSGNFDIVVDEVNMQVAADETYSTPDLISIDEDVDDTGID